MTEPGDGGDSETTGPPTDPEPPVARPRFASSRPIPKADRTLASLIGALATCEHPPAARSCGVVLDGEVLQVPIGWCGACGSIRLPDASGSEWVWPGLVAVLREESAPVALVSELAALAGGLGQLTSAARRLHARAPGTHLEGDLAALVAANAGLERTARSLFLEFDRGLRSSGASHGRADVFPGQERPP